ncbi:MAG TPA: phosphoribosyltransferase family protein [Anaerolineales bacterium]|nr:phosphoribosyltransferase family protein [Anaerolineales bacterium]
MSQELLNLLAARRGHFKFESGHHGDLWLDLDLLFLQPQKLQPFIDALADRLEKYNPAAICGPLVGGALIAHSIAAKLGIEFYYTEPVNIAQPGTLYSVKYRLPKNFESHVSGKKIVVVDDVINAGSAVRATLEELSLQEARPVAIGCLILLGTLAQDYFAKEHIAVESLEALSNNLWMPGDCPLCHSNLPLDEVSR